MATNFLEAAGTNGFIATPFNLMTTELNGLTNGSSATSSVGGTAGVFTQTNFANGIWGYVHFLSGTTASTYTAGSYIAGWFLYSPDGGTSFEKAVASTDLARPADFIIPLINSSYVVGGTDFSRSNAMVKLPEYSCKVFVVNHGGVTLPALLNKIICGPTAIQY